jgi:hypothetical protein
MRDPRLRTNLAELGANLARDLRLHDLARDQRDRLAHEVLQPTVHRLGDDISNRHALPFGHRGVSFTSTAGTADEHDATVVGTTQTPLHHFYLHDR